VDPGVISSTTCQPCDPAASALSGEPSLDTNARPPTPSPVFHEIRVAPRSDMAGTGLGSALTKGRGSFRIGTNSVLVAPATAWDAFLGAAPEDAAATFCRHDVRADCANGTHASGRPSAALASSRSRGGPDSATRPSPCARNALFSMVCLQLSSMPTLPTSLAKNSINLSFPSA